MESRETGKFECPWHLEAEKNDRVITAPFAELEAAFADFIKLSRENKKPAALILELPEDLLSDIDVAGVISGFSQNEHESTKLKFRLLPYLAEIPLEALKLYSKGAPGINFVKKTLDQCEGGQEEISPETRRSLKKGMVALGAKSLLATDDIQSLNASLLTQIFQRLHLQGLPRKSISNDFLSIRAAGSIDFLPKEERPEPENVFSIVQGPFYPTNMPRHSQKLQIVVTNQADFVQIKKGPRRLTRAKANNFIDGEKIKLRRGAVADYKIPGGIWIPSQDPNLQIQGSPTAVHVNQVLSQKQKT